MLDTFAAGGHHNYAKTARLNVQMMLKYREGSPEQQAVIEGFKMTGNRVVRHLSHEWLGIWNDL